MVSGIDPRINDNFLSAESKRVLGYRPTEIEPEHSAKEYVRGEIHTTPSRACSVCASGRWSVRSISFCSAHTITRL